MEQLPSSHLKAILSSKRANLFYLEYCRVLQKDGRIVYLTEQSCEQQYYNIPIANTTVILLGVGTSITQAAVRMLCQAGVVLGFCGGGATPLYMGCEVEWMTPQSEYRPTEYLQGWLSFWFDDSKRLQAAKTLQIQRMEFLMTVWDKDKQFNENGFSLGAKVKHDFMRNKQGIQQQSSIMELLALEGRFAKFLYKFASEACGVEDFSRRQNGEDVINGFLNHGNYLAYGLAATALWVLGIPHGFAVMHGKTRRGALVFDVADLIKDALILPMAFIASIDNATEQEFRQSCLQKFTEHKALDFMFEQVKQLSKATYEP